MLKYCLNLFINFMISHLLDLSCGAVSKLGKLKNIEKFEKYRIYEKIKILFNFINEKFNKKNFKINKNNF